MMWPSRRSASADSPIAGHHHDPQSRDLSNRIGHGLRSHVFGILAAERVVSPG
jgi:hypothetical protein